MKILSISVLLSFLLLSCQKPVVDTETTTSTDNSLVIQEFLQIIPTICERSANKKGLVNLYNAALPLPTGCLVDSISGDTTHDGSGNYTNPDTTKLPVLWLQFANCTGADGKWRNGTISVKFHQMFTNSNSDFAISLQNYIVQGVSFQGSLALKRISGNQFTLGINNGICNTGTANIQCTLQYTVTLNNNGTPTLISDDQATGNGTTSGLNREGRKYTCQSSTPLLKPANCGWITGGQMSVSPAALHSRTLDFGNNNCDDLATMLLNQQTFTLHLPK